MSVLIPCLIIAIVIVFMKINNNKKYLFIHAIKAKIKVNSSIAEVRRPREKDIEKNYAHDLKIKNKLINFSNKYKLDNALISVWEEIKGYPSWSKHESFNKRALNVTNIEINEKNDCEKIINFIYNNVQYAITFNKRRSYLPDSDEMVAIFSLLENDNEVFKIYTDEIYEYDCYTYRTSYIDLLKKTDNWPRFLIDALGEIKISKAKNEVYFRNLRVNEVKNNFKD